MFNRFMKWLVPKIEDWCIRRGQKRMILISGTADPENVYLRRYFVFRSKLFSVYIHRFMRSDQDDHHDHPFDFVGYVVSKGYRESVLTGTPSTEWYLCDGRFSVARRAEGTWAFRKAETRHMVQVDKPIKNDDFKNAPLTVIFRGPWRREWGFWKPLEHAGDFVWVDRCTYLNIPKSDVRE